MGTLTIEAALHETADPRDPREVKHGILKRLDLLDKFEWLPVGGLYTVQGGPIGEPFSLPHGFAEARLASERFPAAKKPIGRVLGKMEGLYDTVGRLSEARENHSIGGLLGALTGSYPIVSGWHSSLDDVFGEEFGEDEAVKLGLAANLPYSSATQEAMVAVLRHCAKRISGLRRRLCQRRLADARGEARRRDQSGPAGRILFGAAATAIEVNSEGAACAVVAAAKGEKPSQRFEARVVLAAPAPQAIAGMLPEEAALRFQAAFKGRAASTSLFSAHFGLKVNPAQFGLKDYSTILLPSWMTSLSDYPRSSTLLGANPNGKLPMLTIANYGAIASGLDDSGGPTLVSVVGVDEISNWRGLSKEDEAARRNAWLDAILGELQRHYPGFAGAVGKKCMSAASMERYLGTPGGAIAGFDPIPPTGPVWKGMPRTPKTPIDGLFLASSSGRVRRFFRRDGIRRGCRRACRCGSAAEGGLRHREVAYAAIAIRDGGVSHLAMP